MPKQDDILLQPDKDFEDSIVELGNDSNTPLTVEELEKTVNSILSTLPKINRNAIRREMENMHVPLQQHPHSSDLTEGLAKAQAYKDRLAEIYNLAMKEYKIRNRCVDMLFDANNFVSKGKSTDVRRGEATLKYPMQLINLTASESFMKEVEQVLQNMKSAHDSISRQVSVMQIQLQLGDVRKSTDPKEINYNKSSEEISRKRTSGETDWDNLS